MSIAKVMTRKLITLDIDDNLQQAKKIFDTYKFHHVFVLEKTKLVGVITDRDIYKHLSPAIGTNKETHADIAMLKKKVHLIMSRQLITATENISLNEAALLFHDHHISCLPIVDDEFKPVGVLTWRDIIKIIALQYRQKQLKSTVEQ